MDARGGAHPSSARDNRKTGAAASLRRPSSRMVGCWCAGRASTRSRFGAAEAVSRAQRAPGRQPPPRGTEQAPGLSALWALTRFDLYAPGLEQAGLGPGRVLYAQGKNDRELLALCEDALRDGSLACVVAEVKAADQTATRRLQLAASEGGTPMLLYRRYRRYGQCPLTDLSLACTRWRIGSLASTPLSMPGVGRGRWSVELVRQRGGPPFSLELEACDDQGRLALPAAAPDRAIAAGGAARHAA